MTRWISATISLVMFLAFLAALIVSVKILYIDDYNHIQEGTCEVLTCHNDQYSCDRTCSGGKWDRQCTSYTCNKVTVTLELLNLTDNGEPYIHVYDHVYTRSEDNDKRPEDPRICNSDDSNQPKGILKFFVPCYYDDRHINSTIGLQGPKHSPGSIAAISVFSVGLAISLVIALYFWISWIKARQGYLQECMGC